MENNKKENTSETIGVISTQERPFHLLGFFSLEKPEWGLSDLARESNLPKASCLRALRVLEKYGMVQRQAQKYRLGYKLISLGSMVQESFPPRRIALAHMEALRKKTQQSVQWVIQDELEGLYVDVLESLNKVRLYISPGRRAPLYAGGSTRLLLAFANSETQNSIFSAKRERYSARTPVESQQLRALLRNSKQTGFAASFGELEPYSAELAAAVFDVKGDMIASISVAGTEGQYLNLESITSYTYALNETAETISRDLGFEGEWQAKPDLFIESIQGRIKFITAGTDTLTNM